MERPLFSNCGCREPEALGVGKKAAEAAGQGGASLLRGLNVAFDSVTSMIVEVDELQADKIVTEGVFLLPTDLGDDFDRLLTGFQKDAEFEFSTLGERLFMVDSHP